jgi:hypothetical protein
MNSRRIHSPFFAEKLRIDDCSERFPRLIKSDGDKAGVLFAEHSRKPPFSLGLQSFLELLLHKIRVPRVSLSVHESDAVSQKQLNKTIVHSMHAVFSADLN